MCICSNANAIAIVDSNTYSNKSSFGPLHTVELGPMDSLLLLHGDLNSVLLSESKLSLVMVAALIIVLI